MTRIGFCLALAALSSISIAGPSYPWAPSAPGKARLGANGILSNTALSFSRAKDGSFRLVNRWTGATIEPHFNLASALVGNRQFPIGLKSARVRLISLRANPRSPTAADHVPAVGYEFAGTIPGIDLKVTWRAVLRDDSNYVRVELTLAAPKHDVDLSDLIILSFSGSQAKVVGKTPGSPIVIGDCFAGIEHPMGATKITPTGLSALMHRALPLRKGGIVTYSAVVGVAPRGQMRRAFLNYVEGERAHPYRTFLHYNSWYDIGYFTPYNEKDCIDRIEKFGEQLVRKRGTKMDSFLFDDGWDNYESVWSFHSGFPNGFIPVSKAAAAYGAAPGVWLSPWGGYGGPRTRRLAYGKAHGMEVDSQGYALSGPNYFKRFHDVTLNFVTKQGINHFKFDGTGSPDKTTPGSGFDSDFDAAISLIEDLRQARPDLFVNLTTGTWPSPFWLRFADTTWRGGADHSFAGVGTYRQQWITYRDGDTFHGVAERGPLYPLNSLMLHGLIYARHAQHLSDDPGNDFRDEVHDYFGNGTQLQEMYITPDLLTAQNWDDLAEAAKWSRENADVLRDTHWVGGDPTKLDVYGWASWSAYKGILVLRNPSDKQQAFSVDIANVLELPPRFAAKYIGRSAFRSDIDAAPLEFPVGGSLVVDLKPFQVLVLDLEARK